jgi:integrase/recombinase XerD
MQIVCKSVNLHTGNKNKMATEIFVSLYLDTRRAKSNGKFPVRIRVFTSSPRIQKLYSTIFEFTEKEFQSIWETKRPRAEFKAAREQLQNEENRVFNEAQRLSPFTFEKLEKVLFRKKGEGANCLWHYAEIIKRLKDENRFGSASSYELSKGSLKAFMEDKTKRVPTKIPFTEITPAWLRKYETYMTQVRGASLTTVGIYLRALRSVFNEAIQAGDIEKELYPFGKNDKKYLIPASSKKKKALDREQLSRLFHAEPANPEQEKAKAFWFFSLACNGMNMKDIALLRYENLDGDSLNFVREKTKNTTRGNQMEISVPLTGKAKAVLEKYGNPNTGNKQFVFPILSDSLTEEEKHWEVKNFTRFVNQHLKRLAESVGITGDISTYWARHSFATNAIRQGASLEFVGEALGHTDTGTTKNYFAGFEDQAKREFLETLLDF